MTSRNSLESQPRSWRPANPVADRLRRASDPVRTFTTEELFAGTAEIAIEHQGARYRLKITRQGKLILNK